MNRLERLENLSAYIDGELTAEEQRLLAAWCEEHPEDLAAYEELATVVSLVRELPLVEPPAGLCDRIRRAAASLQPVEATRAQALEWIDEYLDGEISEPRRQVVDHYRAVDAEFAETFELQAAMLEALAGIGETEVEPPPGLKEQIAAQVARLDRQQQAAPARRLPLRHLPRRLATSAVAALLLCGVVVGLTRGGGQPAPAVASAPAVEPAASQPVVPPTLVAPQPGTAVAIEPAAASATERVASIEPELPSDESDEPVIREGMESAPERRTSEREVRPTPRDDPRQRTADRNRRAPSTPAVEPRRAPAPRPKVVPRVQPQPVPGTVGGGALADGARSSSGNGPEFVHRSGSGSVLGNEDSSENGNPTGADASRKDRGAADPTRRTEVPPF
ncbi:MAG: hypothetical protein IT204_15735 [Fimbriimonadaceae bacterium]|nr:hypothetical protein [Fimbriimonadaceae bacterium]